MINDKDWIGDGFAVPKVVVRDLSTPEAKPRYDVRFTFPKGEEGTTGTDGRRQLEFTVCISRTQAFWDDLDVEDLTPISSVITIKVCSLVRTVCSMSLLSG